MWQAYCDRKDSARPEGKRQMPAQIAEVELVHSHAPDVAKSITGRPVADQFHYQKRPLVAARGIVTATLIVAPFWGLVALALYLLI
jgi:hypothetical protein